MGGLACRRTVTLLVAGLMYPGLQVVPASSATFGVRDADGAGYIAKEGPDSLWMGQAGSGDPNHLLPTVLAQAVTRDQLAEIQRRLSELGFDPGPADGLIGPRTRTAIRAFQAQQGLRVDGEPSPELLGRLEVAVTAQPTASGTAVESTAASPSSVEVVPLPVHECDRLASHPADPYAVTPGVYAGQVDAERAIEACEEAVLAFPEAQRFQYQHARALERAERYEEAVELYRRLAEQGYSMAQVALGWAYRQGNGVLQDSAEAVRWYRKAAEEGNPLGQVYLGGMYLEGNGVPQSDSEALRWYRKAAEQGAAVGQYSLGWMYENGRGVPQASGEAAGWLQQAAEQGYPDAEAFLGWLYLQGRGVQRDETGAVELFRRAAEKGDSFGQRMLGWAYLEGRGVQRDRGQAARWLRQAAEKGDEWALDELSKLDVRMAAQVQEELRRKEEEKERRQAELADQHRREAAREARRAAREAMAAGSAPPIERPAHELLAEALEDLAWAVTAKVDADVEAVASAFWDARTKAENHLDALFAPLEAIEGASARIRAAKDEHALRAVLDNAGDLLELSTMLTCLSLCEDSNAETDAPIHLGRTRTMLEVGNLYSAEQDYLAATRLYLLGFEDLASPVRVPGPTPADDGWLWGALAVVNGLREELRTLARKVMDAELGAEADVGPALARLATLTLRIEAATVDAGAGVLADDQAADNVTDGPRLGAIAALNTVRQRLAKLAPKDGELVKLTEARGHGQGMTWTTTYRMPDGSSMGEVRRSAGVPPDLPPIPSLGNRYSANAGMAPVRLAYEMLLTLPVELANLSQLVADAAAASRAAVGLAEPLDEEQIARAKAAEPENDEPGVIVAAVADEPTGEEAVAPAGARSPAVRISLRDGSVMVADLLGGRLSYRSALGQVEVPVADIVSLGDDGLTLLDGAVLRGELVGGEVAVETRFGRHTLPASDIASIAVEAVEVEGD